MIAPALPATAIHSGDTSSSCRDDSSAALTSTISPGRGMPRLSKPITMPTVRYTNSGGIVSSSESTVMGSPTHGWSKRTS